MITLDLEIAKQELKARNLNLVIVKSAKIIFASDEDGTAGLLKAIDSGRNLAGSSAADSIVGRAAAMLCRYAKVSAVYAVVVSESAVDALNSTGIKFEYENLVPNILNRKKDGICPLEKLAAGCAGEKECYERIKDFVG